MEYDILILVLLCRQLFIKILNEKYFPFIKAWKIFINFLETESLFAKPILNIDLDALQESFLTISLHHVYRNIPVAIGIRTSSLSANYQEWC